MVLLFQVTNQLVIACKEYIRSDTSSGDGNDVLWEKVAGEIKERDEAAITDSQPKNQVEMRLKVLTNGSKMLTLFFLY